MQFGWPSAEQWQTASAVATCIAVIIALVGVWAEIRHRRRDAADRDAAQARLVFESDEASIGSHYLDLKIANHSSEPIYVLSLDALRCKQDDREYTEWRLSALVMDARSTKNTMRPGEVVTFSVEFFDGPRILPLDPRKPMKYEATISYMDARGLRWSRKGLAPPERIDH